MTTTIEVVGSVLGSGLVGALAGKLVEFSKSRDARAKDQEVLAQTFSKTLLDERKALSAELTEERKATDEARDEHASCRRLVSELAGRVEDQEVRLNRTEVSLRDCQAQHAITTSDARALRAKVALLDKRTSDSALKQSE